MTDNATVGMCDSTYDLSTKSATLVGKYESLSIPEREEGDIVIVPPAEKEDFLTLDFYGKGATILSLEEAQDLVDGIVAVCAYIKSRDYEDVNELEDATEEEDTPNVSSD